MFDMKLFVLSRKGETPETLPKKDLKKESKIETAINRRYNTRNILHSIDKTRMNL